MVSLVETLRSANLANSRTALAPILLAAVQNPLNSSILVTALVPIAQTFGVAVATTAWLLVALYLASAVGQATMGKLVDLFGARRVMLAGLVVVSLAGSVGAFAPTLWWLVAARVVLGLGTSAAYPAAMAKLRELAGEGRPVPVNALSMLAIASQVSVAFGPSMGGLIVEFFGWRGTVAFNVPVALLTFVLAVRWLPPDPPRRSTITRAGVVRLLDLPGIGFFAAAISAFMCLTMDVSIPKIALVVIACACTTAFVIRERRTATPFVDLRLVTTNRGLALTYMRQTVTMTIVYAVFYGLVQWWQQSGGVSPALTGTMLLANSVVSIVVAATFARWLPPRTAILTGAVFACSASLAIEFMTKSTPLVMTLVVSAMFGVLGGFNGVANQSILYALAPRRAMGAAAGLFRTAQYVGATTSAGVLALAYGHHATDAGLHIVGIVLAALSVLLVADALFNRTIPAVRADAPVA